eukprot:6191324-Pleurochrysis_carterae.AAC.1
MCVSASVCEAVPVCAHARSRVRAHARHLRKSHITSLHVHAWYLGEHTIDLEADTNNPDAACKCVDDFSVARTVYPLGREVECVGPERVAQRQPRSYSPIAYL